MKRIRDREINHQLKDESSKLKGLVYLEKEYGRAQSVEVEVQRRLKATTEDLENEVNDLRAQLSTNENTLRDMEEGFNSTLQNLLGEKEDQKKGLHSSGQNYQSLKIMATG